MIRVLTARTVSITPLLVATAQTASAQVGPPGIVITFDLPGPVPLAHGACALRRQMNEGCVYHDGAHFDAHRCSCFGHRTRYRYCVATNATTRTASAA